MTLFLMITHHYHIKTLVDFWYKRWIEPLFNFDNDIKFPTRFVARDYKKKNLLEKKKNSHLTCVLLSRLEIGIRWRTM